MVFPSAGNAEAITPAATSIAHKNGFYSPYPNPQMGHLHLSEHSPSLAVDSDSPSSAPNHGNFIPYSPLKSCPAELSKPTRFCLVPVPVFPSPYMQHHQPPKTTETSLKKTTTTTTKEAREAGPET